MPELGIGLGISKGAAPKTKLLLDKHDMDAAFSLRKVRAEYSGPCVRVRNNAGTLKDIGFTSRGVLDEDALNAHCGDNDGTVQTWYNQSTEGGRFNAVQDTPGNQPIIYDASAGGYLGYVENTGDMYLRLENQLTGVTDLAVVYENVSSNTSSAYVLGEHRSDGGAADGVSVGHPTVPGFSLVSGGASIIGHTGGATGEKHAGFGYTSGSPKFSVVDGYVVSSTTATFGSIDLDYIFSRSKSDNPDAFDFLGKVWEVFLSTSDLSGNRIAIENSILSANGLTVPDQTLLEKYDGAEGAFSTRCINREHVGPIIEVRATQTTEVTEDVYLDYTGVVNKSRITSLCTDDEAANALVDGFVETWYDQSSFGYDVTNVTDAQQPKIHDATDGIVLLNGQPAVKFDGSDDILQSSTQSINTEAMICVSSEDADGTGTILRHAAAFIRYKGGATVEYRNSIELRDQTANNATEALGEATLTSWYTKGTDFNDTNASWKWYFNGGILGTKTGNNASSDSSTIKIGAQGSSQELLNGKVCEAIIFDKRDAHYDAADAIHESINKHYLIYQEATASPSSGFLADYSGAAAAYSVRQLGDANICLKVRRSGDDATKNIGFGTDGFVDATAISDFCGSDDGLVVTWFDQSGNDQDATQATASAQPKIYDGTDGIVKENGYPATEWSGGTQALETTYTTNSSEFTVVAVAKSDANATNKTVVLVPEALIFYQAIEDARHIQGNGAQTSYTPADSTDQMLHFVGNSGSESFAGYNGDTFTTLAESTATNGEFKIGNNANGSIGFDGKMQEVVYYTSDQSSNRTPIEENINDAFNIYPDADTTPESGFLNEFSGAAAAYSVRKLGDSPVCMRVRKTVSSVDYYQVIGFDSNGDLDTAAIEEFGGSNDVFVQTWYDQSGNGRHQVQDTSAEQPKIYDGTDKFYYTEDNVAIWFNDQGMEDSSDNQITVLDQSIFVVAKRSSNANTDRSVFVGHSEGGTYQVYAAQVWGGATNNDPDRMVNYAGTTQSDMASISLSLDTKENLRTYGWHHDTDSIFQYNGEEYTPDEDGNSVLSPTQSTYQISVGSKNYNALEAYVTEVIVYEGIRDATTRTNIEKNQNEHFLVHQSASNTPATGLLAAHPAEAAYSVRQLGDALLCMKVASGATGNPTKNIGFKNGVLDTAAIEEFCGNNDGFVATWYDQSGNDNNADQGTHSKRPKIFDQQSGIVKENSKPAAQWDGLDDHLVFPVEYSSTDVQVHGVFSVIDNDNQWIYLRNYPTPPVANLLIADANTTFSDFDGMSLVTVYKNSSPLDQLNNRTEVHRYFSQGQLLVSFDGTISDTDSDNINWGGIGSSGFAMKAKHQELIFYTVDKTASRSDIETNINNYFKIYTPFSTGLLDSYPGAAAAYSLRRLSSAYTGAAIEVTSNGSTQDIGFDVEGNLDTTAIRNFCGANDGTISKWYDQSGNGNDAVQATTANQPKIYDATTGLVTENGEPAVEFDGSNDCLTMDLISDSTEVSICAVHKNAHRAAYDPIIGVGDGDGYALTTQNNKYNLFYRTVADQATTSDAPNSIQALVFAYTKSATSQMLYSNGTEIQNITPATMLTPTTGSSIGAYDVGDSATKYDGFIQEIVLYAYDQSANRSGIEKNINKHYSIYDQPLLDVVPDAAAAYSLRKLRAGYTGPAINVYNGTDYKDIYFKADGSLDTGAISRFCGSNNGTVAIWYDQSGGASHAEQTTAAYRPKIYDGTDGLVTDSNGTPSILFQVSAETKFASASLPSALTQPISISATVDRTDTVDRQSILGEQSGEATFRLGTFVTDTALEWAQAGANFDYGDTTAGLQTHFVVYNGASSVGGINGQSVTGDAGTNGVQNFNIGNIGTANTYVFRGKISELIIYASDQSSNRTVAEANINYYYGIY